MAWKRGTQNNTPGEIRKGHVREFLFPSSKGVSVSDKLRIIDARIFVPAGHNTSALVSSKLPESFVPFVIDGILYVHSHDHPRCVLKVCQHDSIPHGCIALNETQRINSKVCIGELQEWTVYQGDSYAYDAREGAIGDTIIRHSSKPPPHLRSVVVSIRPRHSEPRRSDSAVNTHATEPLRNDNSRSSSNCSARTAVCARAVTKQFSALLHGCIVSSEDIYTAQIGTLEIVGRITDLAPDIALNADAEDSGEGSANQGCGSGSEEYEVVETYRGIVGADTEFYVNLENSLIPWDLKNVPLIPSIAPHKDLVDIYTKDDEHFPVLRRLLRPCLSLTYAVQQGRGIYGKTLQNSELSGQAANSGNTMPSDAVSSELVDTLSGAESSRSHAPTNNGTCNGDSGTVKVLVDVCACTFDKVLLYLEHEARGEQFKFDPLLAAELREASVTLGIAGLQDVCDKVLGSFQERVRRTPIRLSEVTARNKAGTPYQGSKRGETILLLNGMVLDISRWLGEHPGGSGIIPEQALNVDSTVFFEIYHASKQSFLYLKEFYIGELAQEDRDLVPAPHTDSRGDPPNVTPPSTSDTHIKEAAPVVTASAAFLEQLNKLTAWRLKPSEMQLYTNQKSF